MPTARLHRGDCVEVMGKLKPESVDAIVCDPPYELGFMGKSWDSTGVAYSVETWKAAYRVLKPGGHLLAFGGSRTYHRIACAIEDAGFEIRDSLHWIYGSGFPKSMNISMAIDKAAGVERPDRKIGPIMDNQIMLPMRAVLNPGTPQTEEAKRWEGWGTALKPAHEPIVVARKPVEGRVVSNVLKHGTGGINVKATRIGESGGAGVVVAQVGPASSPGWGMKKAIVDDTIQGRWPPNILLSHSPLCREDDEGDVICAEGCTVLEMNSQGGSANEGEAGRFFPCFRYVPKPGNSERNAGLYGMPKRTVNEDLVEGSKGSKSPRAGAGRNGARENFHPTVKPIGVMAWLCKLVTPPGGVVLDPFLGSGTTGIAALRNGFKFIGIELGRDYFRIARNRIKNDSPLLNEVIPVRFKRVKKAKKKITKAKKKRTTKRKA